MFANLSARTHHLEWWDKTTAAWVTEGGLSGLNSGVSFGFGAVGVPPPNTQATIGQASLCTDAAGNPIANTACIMFNSRGVPIDSTLAPTDVDALYLTDGSAVFVVTVAATGMLRLWHAFPAVSPSWVLN